MSVGLGYEAHLWARLRAIENSTAPHERAEAAHIRAILRVTGARMPIRESIQTIMGVLKDSGAIGGLALDMLSHVLGDVDQLGADLRDGKVGGPDEVRQRLTGNAHDG